MAKCSECGFLAIRNTQSRVLEETEQITRDEGYLSTQVNEAPICLVKASDLWAESGLTRGIVCYGAVEVLKSTIQKERDCKQFVVWQQGFTPKEHREMIDRNEMLKWQEAQEKRHSQEEWKRIRFMAIITIVAVILGVILGYFLK